MSRKSGFIAYPERPEPIAVTIREATNLINDLPDFEFRTWEENDIAGRHLTTPIFSGMRNSDLLIADITHLNFNVTYEIGYAIGIGKRAFLITNLQYTRDKDTITKIGIFDTLGYEGYSNTDELVSLIKSFEDINPLNTAAALDKRTPVFIIETPLKGDVLTHLVSRVKKARLFYRSFAPSEESRMSAIDTIRHVSSSYGIIIPLLNLEMKDATVHNIRAAFVAGLSHGLNKHTLLLQDKVGPLTPLDIRDYVKTYTHPGDISQHIHDFSLSVYESLQQIKDIELPAGNLISSIGFGDPMAENEFQNLSKYYLQTDEFGRALRGEVNLVVGRKGTGKTALFSQVRNHKRSNKNNIVVDLKPEGYQLLKLKEDVLGYLSAGSKAHLITAFWEYLLYLEVCHKVLQKDSELHLRNHVLYESYQILSTLYDSNPYIGEGDFSERLAELSNAISQEYSAKYGDDVQTKLMAEDVTSLIHSHNIREIREHLSNYLKHKNETWILFDNLDKGWTTHGLTTGDITILRCLLDAARKIQRDMSRTGHEFHVVVFIRNDVYQLLMEESADFGKELRATLDWNDPDLLREMLRKRLVENDMSEDASFYQLWAQVFVTHYKGEETSQFLIERSLMRPRNLLKMVNTCKGYAVNLQHDKIEEIDIEKGLYVYSNDLIVDADQELTDIEPEANNLIYQFIGEKTHYSYLEFMNMLSEGGIKEENHGRIIEFLLYYSFLGLWTKKHQSQYIYDVNYNMSILRSILRKNVPNITFEMNPAFWYGLELDKNK